MIQITAFYNNSFYILTLVTIFLYFFYELFLKFLSKIENSDVKLKQNGPVENKSKTNGLYENNTLLKKYLLIYAFASLGDWLQGPYLYSLYQSYGYSKQSIQFLFVTGFTSSMFFGTIIGTLADIYGRKLNCLLYFLFYSLSCLSVHVNIYKILLVGRVLGGAATSILMSAFEAWVIRQAQIEATSSESTNIDVTLKNIFGYSTVLNSLMAILAGLISQLLADNYGSQTVFDFSSIILILGLVLCHVFWEENFGHHHHSALNSTYQQGSTASQFKGGHFLVDLCIMGLDTVF